MENQPNSMHKRIGKFLSLILRHSPEKINVTMDKNGWVNLDDIIKNSNQYKDINLSIDLIKLVVETNDKRRFSISDDGKKIRANQGHSIQKIDLNLENGTPPDILYHGTASHYLQSIMKNGLKPMKRQHVHLSQAFEDALAVAKRHGKPVVLYIDAKKMYEDGYKFYLSANNIWLVDIVPAKYITK